VAAPSTAPTVARRAQFEEAGGVLRRGPYQGVEETGSIAVVSRDALMAEGRFADAKK
jgi:hypothetical protein